MKPREVWAVERVGLLLGGSRLSRLWYSIVAVWATLLMYLKLDVYSSHHSPKSATCLHAYPPFPLKQKSLVFFLPLKHTFEHQIPQAMDFPQVSIYYSTMVPNLKKILPQACFWEYPEVRLVLIVIDETSTHNVNWGHVNISFTSASLFLASYIQ